jgi:hypothetical protein
MLGNTARNLAGKAKAAAELQPSAGLQRALDSLSYELTNSDNKEEGRCD